MISIGRINFLQNIIHKLLQNLIFYRKIRINATKFQGDIDMLEGKDAQGFVWIQDTRFENYYYLKDFEHLVVSKVSDFSEQLPKEHWEATIFEDETCSKIVGREEFATMRKAQECLENYVEISLKNHPNNGYPPTSSGS